MCNEGTEPTPSEYWEMTAEPMAAMLANTSIAAIDDELGHAEAAVEKFCESVRIINRSSIAHITAAEVRHHLETELGPLRECAVSTDHINGLANRWSAQLRRAAWRRHVPLLLFRSTAEADAIIGQAQVALVEEPPWAHTDRLLSAFELCHADIRTHLFDRVAEVGTLSPVAAPHSSRVTA